MINKVYRQIRRLVIAVIGCSVLLIGILMVVLPGPAFIVIPTGLAILATEFVWAAKVLKTLKDELNHRKSYLFKKMQSSRKNNKRN